jgi:hypothetical protein
MKTLTAALVVLAAGALAEPAVYWNPLADPAAKRVRMTSVPTRGTIKFLDGSGAATLKGASWDTCRKAGYYPVVRAVVPAGQTVTARAYVRGKDTFREVLTTVPTPEQPPPVPTIEDELAAIKARVQKLEQAAVTPAAK